MLLLVEGDVLQVVVVCGRIAGIDEVLLTELLQCTMVEYVLEVFELELSQ